MKYDPDNQRLTLHQSDISHYLTCPEQFRRVNGLGGGEPPPPDWGGLRVETDAATIGTVLHAVIERELTTGEYASLDSARKTARERMGSLIRSYVDDGVPYRCETYGDDPRRALEALDRLVRDWYESDERQYWLHRERNSFRVEWNFHVPFVTRHEYRFIREIYLGGTADILDLAENSVNDWKSGSRAYQRWEKQRWAVQPTTYTFAAVQEGLITPSDDGTVRFSYRVFLRDGRGGATTPQRVDVYRGPGQWAWLTMLVNNIASMMESNANVWPLSDDHALCGPKWCPVWNDCKGSFVTENWT